MSSLNPADAGAELREALRAFHEGSGETYGKLFLAGRPVRGRGAHFAAFARAGLVRRDWLGRWHPLVRVFPFFDSFVATDLLTRESPDQVFSLMFEQIYLMRHCTVREGDDVLELCSGSGANCICAASLAGSVTGVDINPRAIAFAKFNTNLAAPRTPIAYWEGSLFAPLAKEATYDVILFNPPFEIAPTGEPFYLHSHGGEDGLDVIREALRELPHRLRPGGRLEMITFSPGSDDDPHLLGLLESAFPEDRIEAHLLDDEPVERYTARFHDASWKARLAERGITRIFFLYVRVETGAGHGRRLISPHEEIAASRALAAEWEIPG